MSTQIKDRVSIKGVRDGLLVTFDEGSMESLLNDLADQLDAKKAFFKGSRVILSVGERQLNTASLIEVQELLADYEIELWAVLAETEETKEATREIGLATRLPGSNTDLDGRILNQYPSATEPEDVSSDKTIELLEANSLLVRETIRSGRSIHFDGHVIVLGDVNPGAEIIAGGDVIVWGRLRGLVHAGAFGDKSTVICALELIPTQLRIADQIAISPGDQQRQPIPEMVSISDDQIVAQVWNRRS